MNFASEKSQIVSKQKVISIIIIDDNRELKTNLKTLLQLYNQNSPLQFKVIADSDSIAEGKLIIEKYQPQVLLLDLELQKESGLDILKYLSSLKYPTKTLIISAHEEEEMIFKAMSLGAKGYIFKPNVVSQLREAINNIVDAKIYLPPEAATGFFRLFKYYSKDILEIDNCHQNNYHLTHREKDVLGYLIQGLSNEEISQELYVTIATVKAHLSSIFSKFCVKNRTQAIVMALKENII